MSLRVLCCPPMLCEPNRMAKGGKKKQSNSSRRRQREKKAGEAGLTGDCAEKPASQSLDEKAAINPAKRVEVNDKLHFDSVAELGC